MKKWLKTLSVALLAVPVLTFAACGGSPKTPADPDNDNYQVYRKVVQDAANYTGSYTILGTASLVDNVERADGEAITDEEKTQFELPPEFNTLAVVSYSQEGSVAYSASYDYNAETEEYKNGVGSYIVKDGDNYILYEVAHVSHGDGVFAPEVVSATRVDSNYAKNNFAGFPVNGEGFVITLDVANQYKTFKELKDHFKDIVKAQADIDVENVEITTSHEGENYAITLKYTFQGESLGLANCTATVECTYGFTAEKITKLTMSAVQNWSVTVEAEAVEEEVEGDANPEEPAATVYNLSTVSGSEMEFTYGAYEDKYVPETFEFEGEVTNQTINVQYYLDGENKGSYEATFGDAYALPDGIVRLNTTTQWYTDEAMTVEFDASEYTYPSNDITLYGRSTPKAGYAVVVYKAVTANGTEVTNVRVVLVGYDGVTALSLPVGATLQKVEGAERYDTAANTLTLTSGAYVVVTYKVAE